MVNKNCRKINVIACFIRPNLSSHPWFPSWKIEIQGNDKYNDKPGKKYYRVQ
jgi:hypothetical protein